MKMMECKNKVYTVGFIDPDKVNIKALTTKPNDTEKNILRFLKKQHYCDHILFPYNFKCGSCSIVHINFCLIDVKCNL